MPKVPGIQFVVLKSIKINKLKGLNDCEITFDNPLTAIMGVNGIGKSTIIHALSCCFRKVDEFGEERKFSSFFPPSTNSTWQNSSFVLSYDIVDPSGKLIQEGTKEYKKSSDRWAPRYSSQQKKNIKFIGIDTCTPDIERLRNERFFFLKTTERTDNSSQNIIKQASVILNKDYATLTQSVLDRREFIGVVTRNSLKYSSISMGAGEQRVFRILDSLYKAPSFSLLLVDELDLLLHPEALKQLVKILYDVAEKRHLQVIFTTHSLVMDELKQYVDIRFLDCHSDKVDVYKGLSSLEWKKLSGQQNRPISVFVEDLLSKSIIRRIAKELGILQKVSIDLFGAAENAFVLAASFIIQKKPIDNVLIVLDGDVHRTEEEKLKQIQKKYSGNEEDADARRVKALSLITQYNLPEGASPEQYLHSLLCSIDDPSNEIVDLANRMYAVSNSHDWINSIAESIGDNTESTISTIIEECAKSEEWAEYTKPVREWLSARVAL